MRASRIEAKSKKEKTNITILLHPGMLRSSNTSVELGIPDMHNVVHACCSFNSTFSRIPESCAVVMRAFRIETKTERKNKNLHSLASHETCTILVRAFLTFVQFYILLHPGELRSSNACPSD